MDLKTRTIHGIGWSGISQLSTQGFQVIVKIILARLLVPEDFGIIGMALIFTTLIQTVNELGLSAAIIQRKDVTEKHLSTFFWTSILMGVVLCIIAIAASPLVATLFREEQVQDVVRVLSLGFVFGSVGIVHRALLEKRIDFRSVATTEIGAAALFGISSIMLALSGFGVWSLVVGSILGNLGRSLFLWVLCPWRPFMLFDSKSFGELFGFGKNVMGSRMLNYVSTNADYFLIARFLDATSLGLYTLAYQIGAASLTQISYIISRVAFPTFSIIQDDNAKIRVGYLKVIKYTSLITFPLLAGIGVAAPLFVPSVLGEKWMSMVVPLQILCVIGALRSVGTHVGSILLSKGRSDIQFRWNIFTAILVPGALTVGIKYGITGVAVALTLVSCFLFLIIQKITNTLIDLAFYDFFKALYPATICSAILIISVKAFQRIFGSLQVTSILMGSVLVGATVYMIALRLLDKDSLREVRMLITEARNR
jgi:O-antigen/teichoic acid export membrane protein